MHTVNFRGVQLKRVEWIQNMHRDWQLREWESRTAADVPFIPWYFDYRIKCKIFLTVHKKLYFKCFFYYSVNMNTMVKIVAW